MDNDLDARGCRLAFSSCFFLIDDLMICFARYFRFVSYDDVKGFVIG